MSSLPKYINVEVLQEAVRLYAHHLLIGYEDTEEDAFWIIAEKMAEIYEYLLTFAPPQKAERIEPKFPDDYWLLCHKKCFHQ